MRKVKARTVKRPAATRTTLKAAPSGSTTSIPEKIEAFAPEACKLKEKPRATARDARVSVRTAALRHAAPIESAITTSSSPAVRAASGLKRARLRRSVFHGRWL